MLSRGWRPTPPRPASDWHETFARRGAGAGVIGRRHIELVLADRDCNLAAIVDPASSASEIARKTGVPLFSSLADLFARERPDGVIIATPNNLHLEHDLACIAAAVLALIEKPIADSIEAGQRLCEAADRAKVPLMVGHHRQHSPIMVEAVDIVRSGRLGRLVAVVGTAMFYKPDSYFTDAPWRGTLGSGPILINLIHEIGNLRALCGEIAAVQAIASQAVRGFPVEDTAAIALRFVNGVLGFRMNRSRSNVSIRYNGSSIISPRSSAARPSRWSPRTMGYKTYVSPKRSTERHTLKRLCRWSNRRC
jgi:predicted dehydrogenase